MSVASGALLDALRFTVGVCTGIALLHFASLVLVRRGGDRSAPVMPKQPLKFVFMIPALNEALVISESVRQLRRLPGDPAVMVIDDGSNDRTAEIVRSLMADDPQVSLLVRQLPEARQGKGAALNAGYRALRKLITTQDQDPGSVIVGVLDADGLLDAHATSVVAPWFSQSRIGALQIGVRIMNRASLVSRLQDVEFFTFVSLIQQGRQQLGSVGLGGNGQFTRLTALMDLGDAPWTDCLTEDLDLGLQLITAGWKLGFTNDAHVHQQGLVSVRALVRQRTRWVQGYFQCWRRIPGLLRTDLPWIATVDLLYSLIWPAVSCLVFPISILLLWIVSLSQLRMASLPAGAWATMILASYGLGFCVSAALVFAYRSRSRDLTVGRAVILYHLVGFYQFVWTVAAWRAVGRIVLRRRAWSKTERVSQENMAPPSSIPGT